MITEDAIQAKINEIEKNLRASRELKLQDFHIAYHTESVKFVTIDGLWMEFGVYRGRTLDQLCSLTHKDVYGFDSFEGLPEFWDHENPKGVYGLGGVVPPGVIVGENQSMYSTELTKNYKPWPSNAKLIKGWFEDTLPVFVDKFQGYAALLHIDSDIYSAAKTIFKYLKNRIIPGTIIIFDEIYNYPSYRDHEIRAFAEFLLETNYNYEALLQSGHGYGQGTFRILK